MSGLLSRTSYSMNMVKTTTVNDFMTRKFETIQEADSVKQAAKKMKDMNVSSLVVVDTYSNPIGLVTERDIVRKAFALEEEQDVNINAIRVADILSSPLVTIPSNSTPEQAADVLLKNKIRHLLVVEKKNDIEKPAGIITPMDFTRYRDNTRDIYQKQRNEEDDVIEKIMKYYRD
jgi:signal-transduction protein with cAMP-binding, CBS, and nucleotidyltransferase domain